MEYKPPFDNHSSNPSGNYRYLYCLMNPSDEWMCVRCEDEEKCYWFSSMYESKGSKMVKISRDVPESLDRVIVMAKLSSTKVEMKK